MLLCFRSFYSESRSWCSFVKCFYLCSRSGVFNNLHLRFYVSYFSGLMTPLPYWLTWKTGAVCLTVACSLFSQNTITDQKVGWIVILLHISCLETVSSALSGGWFEMWARHACMQTLKSWSFSSALDYTENLLAGLNFVIEIDKTSLWSLYSFALQILKDCICSPWVNISPCSSNAIGKDLWSCLGFSMEKTISCDSDVLKM